MVWHELKEKQMLSSDRGDSGGGDGNSDSGGSSSIGIGTGTNTSEPLWNLEPL